MSQFRTPGRRRQRELDDRRRSEADIKHRHYVRPYGNRGLHVVKSAIDGAEYVVSGPGRTFQPGTVVPTGSNTGTQGEVILTDPTPGRRGAGNFPPNTIVKRQCPQSLMGRRYIGITDSGASDVVQAWDYLDGTLLGLLDTASLPAELQTSGDLRFSWILTSPTTVAFLATDTSNDDRVVIWHLGGSVGMLTNDSGSDFYGRMIWTLGSVWFTREIASGEDHVRVYRGPPVIGEGAAAVANIEVSDIQDSIDDSNLAVIGGQAYIWSDDIDSLAPGNTRWCGDGIDNFSQAIPDIGSGAGGGQQMASGQALVGHFDIVLAGTDFREISITPPGWTVGSNPKLAVSNESEYGVTVTGGGYVRLPIKDYSGVSTSNCGTPGFPVVSPSGLSLKAFLPI